MRILYKLGGENTYFNPKYPNVKEANAKYLIHVKIADHTFYFANEIWFVTDEDSFETFESHVRQRQFFRHMISWAFNQFGADTLMFANIKDFENALKPFMRKPKIGPWVIYCEKEDPDMFTIYVDTDYLDNWIAKRSEEFVN